MIYVKYRREVFSIGNWPFLFLIMLFPWLIIQLLNFSHEPSLQLLELKSLWARAFLACLIGNSLGLVANSQKLKECKLHNSSINFYRLNFLLIFSCFVFPFIAFTVRYLYEIYLTGELIHHNFYYFPYKSKIPYVIFSSCFLPLCFVLSLYFLKHNSKARWLIVTLFGIFLCLLTNYFAGTKNGIFIFFINLILFFFAYLKFNLVRRNLFYFGLALSLIIFSGFVMQQHYSENIAWSQLSSDIKVGADIENQSYWKERDKNSSLPLNEFGNPVNTSTYERVSWFVAGSKLLLENPYGYGLVHHAFGSFAKSRWPLFANPIGDMRGATHSGWLDFALGVGIPGLLILMVPLITSWLRFRSNNNLWCSYGTWAIPSIFLGYLICEANDEHFIEFLLFMVAFFCGLSARYQNKLDSFFTQRK